MGLAEPTGGKFGDVQGTECGRVLGGDIVDDGGCVVGGAVVDDDDLEVRIVLREERVESGGDVGGFVTRGYDDGDRGSACR